MAVSEAIDETAGRISRRARTSAIRDVGAMAGEAIPWLGIAVIVGVTSLEIKDLCDTIRDMNALKRAFDPDSAPGEDETTVCSMAIPSRQELWEKVKASPDAAWQRAREVAPTLPEMTEFTMDWRERITEGIEKAIDKTRQGGADMMDRVWREAPDVAK